ncbi:glycosyltransferase [Alloprevotella sp. OH1205_COT-284]|uniref:glycosyltransferase n=1 Tax=Alloprevotella sp. OH1205_COT-284 TaxID=2491043 RepID=UPI000F5F2093|nr:glycosyltransferase [Alloprevotella sp. OH1205_COT-284]RRD80596.1 glycosyltransferase [Alloprevotella sp. OH1205_COT-284]
MKVLHICSDDKGGAGLCCLRLHQALLNQGVRSNVLLLNKTRHDVPLVFEYGRKKYFFWRLFNKVLRLLHLRVTNYNKAKWLCKRTGGVYTLPLSVVDVASCKLVNDADIIHLHWVGDFIDYPSFFRKIQNPIVWTLHDENLFFGIAHYEKQALFDNYLEKKYYDIKLKIIHSVSNLKIVFLSEMMYGKFHHHEMIKGRHSSIINNSVDCNKYKPFDKKKSRQKFGISETARVFVFVAALITDPRKGLIHLVEAIEQLQMDDTVILAVGNNLEKVQLPHVFSVGAINDAETISKAYSCADYFVMPSKQEAFAQTPIEAMACGIPAIVFPVSGTKELINDNNGIIANGFTSQDLEIAIRIAIAQTFDSKAIRQDMINRFSPDSIAKKYINLYNEL